MHKLCIYKKTCKWISTSTFVHLIHTFSWDRTRSVPQVTWHNPMKRLLPSGRICRVMISYPKVPISRVGIEPPIPYIMAFWGIILYHLRRPGLIRVPIWSSPCSSWKGHRLQGDNLERENRHGSGYCTLRSRLTWDLTNNEDVSSALAIVAWLKSLKQYGLGSLFSWLQAQTQSCYGENSTDVSHGACWNPGMWKNSGVPSKKHWDKCHSVSRYSLKTLHGMQGKTFQEVDWVAAACAERFPVCHCVRLDWRMERQVWKFPHKEIEQHVNAKRSCLGVQGLWSIY